MNTLLRRTSFLLFAAFWLGAAPFVSAQTAPFRHELLSLLPDDFSVCVVMHDLRGQSHSWERSDWCKNFRSSPLGKTLLEAPELKQLDQWERDLKTHLGLDWPALRDDVLGDTVLLSYRPGPANKPEDERGLILVHARKPERMRLFIDRLNEVQKKSGELKELTPLRHKEKTYYRRVADGKKQFYFVEGPLLAFSSQEDSIQGVLAKIQGQGKDLVWANRFRRAGADRAFVTLCINPQSLESEFFKNINKDTGLKGYWQALEGIFVSLSIRDEAELRVTVQANLEILPKWSRGVFTETSAASALWERFPESSILTVASRTDFSATVETLKTLMPEKDREILAGQLQRTLGVFFLGRDLFRDVLPNVGPDWGMCVFPAKEAEHLPQALIALAVKPGSKEPPVDKAFFDAVQLFGKLALFEYNKNHADEIRLESVKQDKTEVWFLSNERLFPPGIRPACALKDGFLVFASSPDAILQFRLHETKSDGRKEAPLLRLSTWELAKLLRQRHESIVVKLRQKQRMAEKEARKNLASVIALLELFDRFTLSQQADAGQASWTLRLTPAVAKRD